MSPLACSLLALAALVAVAQSEVCGPEVLIGTNPQNSYDIRKSVGIPAGGGHVNVPDYCSSEARLQLAGESVTACNEDPMGGLAPVVQPSDPTNPHLPFDVQCPDECEYGATAYIVQHCGQALNSAVKQHYAWP